MTTTPAPNDHDAIRERAITFRANQLQHEKTHDRATALAAAAILCAQDVPALLAELAEARRERDEWRREWDEQRQHAYNLAGQIDGLREELAKTRADAQAVFLELERDAAREEAGQWEKRYADMLDQRDTAIQQHTTAREELAKARAELEEMEKHQARLRQTRNDAIVERSKLIHHMMTVRCWKNEDGKLFVFADDLFSILDNRANPATTAEPADEPKATCHLPVQNGEPCGLLTCRKHGCRVAPTAEPTRTYLDMPVINCGTDVSHMAHVYPVDGVKVVCRGLLPHSVPLDDPEPAAG